MIDRLLPAHVATAEAFADPDPPPLLFPEEERHVARAVARRRGEFGTVRMLARSALARLGGPCVPLLPGERGAPAWPAGFTGSMTHCHGYRGAAVARVAGPAPGPDAGGPVGGGPVGGQGLASVGIDAEPNEPLPGEGLLRVITLPEERPKLGALAARWPRVCWERLVFSAKESVYKAWFPLTGRWLGFEDAVIDFSGTGPETGSFTARLLVPGPEVNGTRLPGFTGRWLAADGLLVTAIAVGVPLPCSCCGRSPTERP